MISHSARTSGATMMAATSTESRASITAMIRAQMAYRTAAHDTRSASAACRRAKADRRLLGHVDRERREDPGDRNPEVREHGAADVAAAYRA